jgi:DNA-binding transcriptional ArsR family regulator
LAKGHALLTGRNYVISDDLPLIIKVVLSTAPIERVTIFDILLGNNGILTVNQITESLNVSEPTARRTMTELKALGLVNMQKADVVCNDGLVRNSLIITLKEEFNWFLSDEFKTLRQDFVPGTIVEETEEQQEASGYDNSNNNNNSVENEAMKEKSPPYLPSNNSLNSYNDNENQKRVYGGENSFTAYSCYHCNSFQTNSQSDYERHNVINHPGKGAYPSKAEIEKRGLKAQGKDWEI